MQYPTSPDLFLPFAPSPTKLSGVDHAVITNALPYSDKAWLDECQIENRPRIPGNTLSALRLVVSADYFDAFHISLVAAMPSGRTFSQNDDLPSQPVAVVSRDFASLNFPGGRPVSVVNKAAEVRSLYRKDKLTKSEIARNLGISPTCVRRFLQMSR